MSDRMSVHARTRCHGAMVPAGGSRVGRGRDPPAGGSRVGRGRDPPAETHLADGNGNDDGNDGNDGNEKSTFTTTTPNQRAQGRNTPCGAPTPHSNIYIYMIPARGPQTDNT